MRKLWITAVVLAVDQVTKWAVTARMDLYESVSVLGDFFRITYIHNPGAVFGIRFGGPYLHLVFAAAAMAAVGSMLWRVREDERLAGTGLALVMGGAVGNVIDRLHVGEVIDFLDFGFGTTRWYIFNVADACVTTGVCVLILAYGLLGKPDAPEATHRTDRTDE